MENSQVQNIKNTIWNLLEVGIAPVLYFLTVPWYIAWIGETQFGVFTYVNTIVVLGMIANFGLNTSTYKHVAQCVGKKDLEGIKPIVNSNLTLVLLISSIVALVIAGMSIAIRHGYLVDSLEISSSTIALAVLAASLLLFGKFVDAICFSVYRAFHSFRTVTLLFLTQKVLQALLILTLAYTGFSIDQILWSIALSHIIVSSSHFFLLRRFIPQYHFRWTWNLALIKKEMQYSLTVWMQSIVVISAFQGDKLFVSKWFGLEFLGIYGILSTSFNHIHVALGALCGWVFPHLSNGSSTFYTHSDFYKTVRDSILLFSTAGLGILLLVSDTVFPLWLGENTAQVLLSILPFFIVFQSFFSSTVASQFFLNALSEERFNLYWCIAYSGGFLLGLTLGKWYWQDPSGALRGMCIGSAIPLVAFHMHTTRRFLGGSLKEYLLPMIPPLFLLGCLAASDLRETLWAAVIFLLLGILCYGVFGHFSKRFFDPEPNTS